MAQSKRVKVLSARESRERAASYMEALAPGHPLALEYKRIALGKGLDHLKAETPLGRCIKGCPNTDRESPGYMMGLFGILGWGAHVNNTHIDPETDQPWPGHEVAHAPTQTRVAKLNEASHSLNAGIYQERATMTKTNEMKEMLAAMSAKMNAMEATIAAQASLIAAKPVEAAPDARTVFIAGKVKLGLSSEDAAFLWERQNGSAPKADPRADFIAAKVKLGLSSEDAVFLWEKQNGKAPLPGTSKADIQVREPVKVAIKAKDAKHSGKPNPKTGKPGNEEIFRSPVVEIIGANGKPDAWQAIVKLTPKNEAWVNVGPVSSTGYVRPVVNFRAGSATATATSAEYVKEVTERAGVVMAALLKALAEDGSL